MIYLDYEEYRKKYINAQAEYNKILNRKEQLFLMTQPKATKFDKEPIKGGKPVDSFNEYVIKKDTEEIEERLKEAYSILKDREMLLNLKEQELKQSKDWNDIIYKYSYIDHLSSRKIEVRIPFSKTEICRKLKIIENNIKHGTK